MLKHITVSRALNNTKVEEPKNRAHLFKSEMAEDR